MKSKAMKNVALSLTQVDFEISYAMAAWDQANVKELEDMKSRIDASLARAEGFAKGYKTLPKTLSDTFKLARTRKRILKGVITKRQMKLGR